MAAARLLAAQGMVREGFMAGAVEHGPVSGWPSPSSSTAVQSSAKKVNARQQACVLAWYCHAAAATYICASMMQADPTSQHISDVKCVQLCPFVMWGLVQVLCVALGVSSNANECK